MSTQREPTTQRRNLTTARANLRSLHTETRPPRKIEYRGHTIHREPSDQTQSGCYRIVDANGQFLDAIEPSDFHNADDWVRYVDTVIHSGREKAREEYGTLIQGWCQQ